MIEVIGSEYGQWAVDLARINADSVVYSVGVGHDATFEQELIRRCGCNVCAFDPTPDVKVWVEEQKMGDHFVFFNVGISEFEGTQKFYHHREPTFQTRSVVPGGSWEKTVEFEAQCWSLKSAAEHLNHHRIDYLKLCTGGDYEVNLVRAMLRERVFPTQLALISMHMEPRDRDWVHTRLAEAGYMVAWVQTQINRELWIREEK